MKLHFERLRTLLGIGASRKGTTSTDAPDPEILSRISDLFKQEKVYLKHHLSLAELAAKINVSPHKLSAFINNELGMSFNEFVNIHRISYCITFLQNAEIKKVNIAELSSLCGFGNRNSFTAAFRKFTGATPSAYIRSVSI